MPVMKRKHNNLLDSTGDDWFRRRCVGAHMLHEGRVLQLYGIVNNGRDLSFRDVVNGGEVVLPKTVIVGFGQFRWPQLGYRQIGEQIFHLTKKMSWDKGLRRDSVHADRSPASRALYENYNIGDRGQAGTMMQAVFLPNYGKPDDLDAVIAGDRLGVVLNHDVMIEPSVARGDDDWVVYMRERPCGRLNAAKRFKWYAPEYKDAIMPLLGGYGVHE